MNALYSAFSFTERILLLAFVASALALAGAHFSEKVGGLPPCMLCLDQREAHWTAMGVAAAGLIAARLFKAQLGAAAAIGAAALVYAVSAGLAFYHTGVEFSFWPGPASCSGGGVAVDIDAVTRALEGGAPAPACDEAPWRLFGVSMAGYNMLLSAGLFALTFGAAIAVTRQARRKRTSSLFTRAQQ